MRYIITYDLKCGTEEEYNNLHTLIESLADDGMFARVQQSVWLIDSGRTSQELFDAVSRNVSRKARVIVGRLSEALFQPEGDNPEPLFAFIEEWNS